MGGVAAFVRRQLEAAGLSKSSVPLAATALVDNSRFKLAINWNKFASLKERISHAVLLQEDADTSKKRGVAAHVRQELTAVGVPEDRVHNMAQALVQESEFRSSINWSKIEHLKFRVERPMEWQETSPLETRGVAAQVRQELKDAGVAKEHVLPLARALVDESKFKSSLNWEKFAQLKDQVLGRVRKQAALSEPSARRGVASHVREELKAVGVPEAAVLSTLQAIVDESNFKPSIDWAKLGKAKDRVWELLQRQGERTASPWRGVAAHMRSELLVSGVPEGGVHLVLKGLVDDAKWKDSVNWKTVVRVRAEMLERLKLRGGKLEQSRIVADVRRKLIGAGVLEDRVDGFMKKWFPSVEVQNSQNMTLAMGATDHDSGEADATHSSPELVVLIVLVAASCCLVIGVCAVCWRRHAKTRSECGNAVRNALEGQIEAPVVGKSEVSVYISEGASTATPDDGHSVATASEFGEPVDAVKV